MERDHDTAALIREHGLKATRPRTAIYDVLRESGGHRSADDLIRMLDEAGVNLPRASVYNVLEDLTTAGLLMRADRGPGSAVYEIAKGWHHHFVCRSCGAVIDVPCVAGAKPCLESDIPGFNVDEAQIIFRGECGACAAARGR